MKISKHFFVFALSLASFIFAMNVKADVVYISSKKPTASNGKDICILGILDSIDGKITMGQLRAFSKRCQSNESK